MDHREGLFLFQTHMLEVTVRRAPSGPKEFEVMGAGVQAEGLRGQERARGRSIEIGDSWPSRGAGTPGSGLAYDFVVMDAVMAGGVEHHLARRS